MKLEFAGVKDQFIKPRSVFFLYGNYKSTFDLFCNFIAEKIRIIFGNCEVEMRFLSVAESLKIINGQCDLFASAKIDCLCLRNVEDSHWEKLSAVLHRENTIFVLECGDYAKSRRITDYCQKDEAIYAIASFKNDVTFYSLCRMFFPIATKEMHRMLVAAMGTRDESLSSFFTKVSLLLEDSMADEPNSNGDSFQIAADDHMHLPGILKQTFLQELSVIPLVRYLANTSIKKKFYRKHQINLQLNIQKKDVFKILLEAEIRQKLWGNVQKSHIYQALM
ncbi:MAG: hypothetical protein LBT90_01670 [Holosporaceae bacterium]|jgi:hypothetical protein|nr:hypothetical protein [Holosporaceae bacterium]